MLEGRVSVNGTTVCELGSKADPEHDDIRVRFGSVEGKAERIPDDISNQMEYFRHLIIVREDNGVTFLFKRVDRGDERLVDGPFNFRDNGGDAVELGPEGKHALQSENEILGQSGCI